MLRACACVGKEGRTSFLRESLRHILEVIRVCAPHGRVIHKACESVRMLEGKRGMGRVRDVGTEVQRTTSAPRVWRYRIFSSEVAAEQVNRHLTVPQRWVFMIMGVDDHGRSSTQHCRHQHRRRENQRTCSPAGWRCAPDQCLTNALPCESVGGRKYYYGCSQTIARVLWARTSVAGRRLHKPTFAHIKRHHQPRAA